MLSSTANTTTIFILIKFGKEVAEIIFKDTLRKPSTSLGPFGRIFLMSDTGMVLKNS